MNKMKKNQTPKLTEKLKSYMWLSKLKKYKQPIGKKSGDLTLQFWQHEQTAEAITGIKQGDKHTAAIWNHMKTGSKEKRITEEAHPHIYASKSKNWEKRINSQTHRIIQDEVRKPTKSQLSSSNGSISSSNPNPANTQKARSSHLPGPHF